LRFRRSAEAIRAGQGREHTAEPQLITAPGIEVRGTLHDPGRLEWRVITSSHHQLAAQGRK
jgi:hypothetical protein